MSSIQVYVRLRPVFHAPGQEPEETCIRAVSGRELEMINWRNTTQSVNYQFEQVFGEDTSQEEIFGTVVQPQLQPQMSRFLTHLENVSVFAYGPTGSGKTHTILGTDDSPGFIPRVMQSLFTKVRQNNEPGLQTLSMSYIEIYQENIIDLLSTSKKSFTLKEDKNKNIIIPGITEKIIDNFESFESVFVPASKNRRVEKTKLNERSSRSHAILIIRLYSKNNTTPGKCQVAKLSIIDLAGSEDNRRTGNAGVRLKESGAINASLHVLSKVVDALCSSKPVRIPYRDSKLTRLLQDSLGGSSHTSLVLNVSPELSSLLDTQSALNFASKSKQVVNKPFGVKVFADAPLLASQKEIKQQYISEECKENIVETSFLHPSTKQHPKKHKLEMLEKAILAKQQASAKKKKLVSSNESEKNVPSIETIKDIRDSAFQFKLFKEHIVSDQNEEFKEPPVCDNRSSETECFVELKQTYKCLHPNLVLTPKCKLSKTSKVFTLSVKK
ncbi:kinesin-like protein KIF22 [Ciona intestinalis]